VDNIKKDFAEVSCKSGDWIKLTQDRGAVVRFCEYGNEPESALK
jgi:hypothetical protein